MNGFRSGRMAGLGLVVAPKDYLVAVKCGGKGKTKGSVLVLGDGALDVLDPRAVGRRCRPPACILLAVPKFVAFAQAARWHEESGAELVEPEDIETRLAEAVSLPLRKPLPPISWAPVPERADSITIRVLRAVPRLDDLSPAGLAKALGMKPRRLLRACASRFRMSPVCLLWRYKHGYFIQRRAEGASLAEIAFELGLGYRSSLLRGLHAHGVELPPRTPGGQQGGVRNGHPHVRNGHHSGPRQPGYHPHDDSVSTKEAR